jgi:hypothetical protein
VNAVVDVAAGVNDVDDAAGVAGASGCTGSFVELIEILPEPPLALATGYGLEEVTEILPAAPDSVGNWETVVPLVVGTAILGGVDVVGIAALVRAASYSCGTSLCISPVFILTLMQ